MSGYKTQVVEVGNSTSIDVVLAEGNQLDEEIFGNTEPLWKKMQKL